MSTTHFSGPVFSAAGFGSGDSTTPVAITSGNLSSAYATSTATSGDVRLNYNKLTFTGAGAGGEVGRDFAVVTVAAAAPGDTINGRHITLSIDGSGTLAGGAGNALRATIGGTSTAPGGTLASLQLDSDFASTSANWNVATFLRCTNSNTGKIANFMNIPAPSNGTMFATHTDQVMDHSVRIVDDAGVVYYVMCTTVATGRG